MISNNYEEFRYSYKLCANADLIIAKHTSLADECLAKGIPVIFHEYTHNTKKLVLDYPHYLPKDFKMTRNSFTIFQFHSDQGPYSPIFNIRVTSKLGLTVDISTSQGAFNDETNACGGSVKFKVNVLLNLK